MDKFIELPGGVKLSRITAGCMRFDNMEGAELLRFVEQCLELDVNTFDHAPVYGSYTIEAFFGDNVLSKNNSIRDKIKLVTKTGIVLPNIERNKVIYYNSSPSWIMAELERSLKKLKTDHVDLFLIHRPDSLMNIDEAGKTLDDIVQSGKALSVGVSNFSAAGFSALQSRTRTPLAVNQVEISAIYTENIFNGLLDDALERNLALMAWSPVGGGSVFSAHDEQSSRLRTALEEISGELGVDADTLLYAWILRLPSRVIPVTGTSRIERIRSAVKALDINLCHDHWYRVLAASRGFDVP